LRRRSKKHTSHPDIRVHRRTAPGSPPGVVSPDPSMPKSVIQLMAYNLERCVETPIADVGEIPAFLKQYPVVWVNVEGLGDATVIEQLGGLFELHRLALEDVVNVHQRAKLDEYGEVLFIVLRMATCQTRVTTEQLSMFVGKGYILTFQEGEPGDSFDRVRLRMRDGAGRMRQQSSDYLAYALIDAVIDNYYPVLETLAERIDQLEDTVLEVQGRHVMDELHEVKSDLLILRRAIWPLRDAVALLSRQTEIFSDSTRVYLRDCYDHVVQIVDLVETYRELTADLRDLYMSSMSNRINETMRVLTIISTIFIPLTFITSIYGMNFDYADSHWNMPELHSKYGYPAVWLVMLLTALTMIGYFWRQGWIFRRMR
jgi:magnesium transporter